MKKIIPVILCGGSGTRLWPISRQDTPKQFLSLIDDFSLFQNTVNRALRVSGASNDQLVVVSLGDMVPEAVRHLNDIGDDLGKHVLGEPEARNTAAAFGLAALYVQKHFGDNALMLILPSDHHIENEAAFSLALQQASRAAEEGYLVTFGIMPTRPETGYGYIAVGDALSHPGAHAVREFVEKPALPVAEGYVSSGDYMWSSGMHIFRVDTALTNFTVHAPETIRAVKNALEAGISDKSPSPDLYSSIKKEPFEKAVLEKASNIAVVPCDISWSDIGSWESLWEISSKDVDGNVTASKSNGKVIAHNTRNSLIHAHDRLVTCIGLNNVVVVETGDSILIADKTGSDGIKAVVSALQKMDATEVTRSTLRKFSWGSSEVLTELANFRLKEMIIRAHGKRSMKMHFQRSELWVVISGEGTFTLNGEKRALKAQDTVMIPPRHAHSIVNTGTSELRIHKFQYGNFLEESNIVSFSDPYGEIAAARSAEALGMQDSADIANQGELALVVKN